MNPTQQKSTVSEALRKQKVFFFLILVVLLFFPLIVSAQTTALKFETTIAKGLIPAPQNGRLFILLNRKGENEPRFTFDDGDVGFDAPPILAKDVSNFKAGETKAIIDNSSISYPIKNLAELPAGEYFVQALFDTNNDLRSLNAPGNLIQRGAESYARREKRRRNQARIKPNRAARKIAGRNGIR